MCNYKSIGPSDRFSLSEILIHKAGSRNQDRRDIDGSSLLVCQGQTRMQGTFSFLFFPLLFVFWSEERSDHRNKKLSGKVKGHWQSGGSRRVFVL